MDFHEKCKKIGGNPGIFKDADYCYIPLDLMDDIFGKNSCKTIFDGYVLKNLKVCSIQRHRLDEIDISLDVRYKVLQSAAEKYVPKEKTQDEEEFIPNYIPGKPLFYWGELDAGGNPCLHLNLEGDQRDILLMTVDTDSRLAERNDLEFHLRDKEGRKLQIHVSDTKGNHILMTTYPHLKDVPRLKIIIKNKVDDSLLDAIKAEIIRIIQSQSWLDKRRRGAF